MKQREDFLANMKERLLARIAEIQELIKEQSEGDKTERQVQDSADEAHLAAMSKLQSSLEKTEINELKQIEEALARIETGKYGICGECEQPIGDKRLEAFPFVVHCISCQEKLEG